MTAVVVVAAIASAVTASVWIAYWDAKSVMMMSRIDGWEKSMFCRDTLT